MLHCTIDDSFIPSMSLEKIFTKAAQHARTLDNISDDEMLKLYAFYKQACDGPCKIPKPPFWDFTGKAKWESWKAVYNLSCNESKAAYVALVEKLDENWTSDSKTVAGMGVSVSTFHEKREVELADKEKTIFNLCEEGSLEQVLTLIQNDPTLLHVKDSENLSLLHWSVDRGHLKMTECLVTSGCDVNALDSEQQTPLHYAVTCERDDLVTLLLRSGADPTLKDMDGNCAVECASEAIRTLFSSQ